MEYTSVTMGTQNKTKSSRISNPGLPFRRYSMPETVMRKYSLKRQRSVQSPPEFGLPGTKDQGCQTDFSVFNFKNLEGATTKKISPSHRLSVVNEKMMMRCSRCNRSSERRHSYSCKYNIVCSKCKQTWRKTSLPVSIISVSKGGETLRKTNEICRGANKTLFQSGSSPENKIQFDIEKIIERSSDVESDFSREADNMDVYDRFPMEPNIESELSRLESNQEEIRLENVNLDKSDEGEIEHPPGRTTKMFEERILKMLDTYCPHMQCTLNMFMGSKRPHSEGSQRSQSSCDVKRPKSASARLPGGYLVSREANGDPEGEHVVGLNNGNIANLDGGDRSGGTQNILIIDHDNISSTENTPGSTTRECDSCHGSCPKCCSQEFSDTPHTFSCCCTSPDTTIEMKTSSGSGLTSSSGTLDQTVSDLTGSTQDSTLSITSVTPEDKSLRLKSTSPLPIVLSSECIIMNPIVPEQEDLNTTGSTQVEETEIEISDGPFPTVINSETTLIEPLEKGYISKKDMHNYSVHFLDSGHSDSSDEIKKGKKHQTVRIVEENKESARPLNEKASQQTTLVSDTSELHENGNENKGSVETVGLSINQFHRDRRKSVCANAMSGINAISEEEKTEIEQPMPSVSETVGEREVISSDTALIDPGPLICGTDKVNESAPQKRKLEDIVELVCKNSSQDIKGVSKQDTKSRTVKKLDISTQFSGIPDLDDSSNNIKGLSESNKSGNKDKKKSRREKREAKLAELSDLIDDLEIRDAPIGSISATTYYEGISDDFLVPRYSAAPRSVSMFVNTSSEYSSDSDLSYADSLEDRLSPVPERRQSEFSRYDNRLVRGEVTEIQMINDIKHKRRMKRCYAYFVTLSGEQTSISVTTMPESIRNRLIMKEKQIRYLCRRRHSSRKVYCKRSAHRLCSKHRYKQKHTQTSPLQTDPTMVDQKTVNASKPEDIAIVTGNLTTTGAPISRTDVITTVSTGVQTTSNVSEKKEGEPDAKDYEVQNYDRIMIGFRSNNVETSIYYSQDVTAVKKTSEVNNNENVSSRPKNRAVKNDAHQSDRERTQSFSKEKYSKQLRRDVDIDEQICQILLAGLKDQENGHMVFVEETQTFYSKSNVKKISTSAQTTDGVQDTATLTDLSYDCRKNEKVANTPDLDSGSNTKLTALQKSEETLEKLQKINETLRKEIQETKLRCNQGTQVNFDKTSREPEPENGNSYGNLLNHTNNFKQANFAEYRRARQLEPSRNRTKLQPPKTNSRLAPKGVSKRSSNLLGSKFRQKFEVIPEEKSSGSFESTEDSAEATPRESSNGEKVFNVNDVKICRSATDCRLTQDDFLNEHRRHTVGNLMVSDPDVIYERSTERRRNTVHGNMSVSNTQTLVNTEHLKRSTGNLNLNVSRRTGQIIGKRTSMMVGRFERVNGELKNGDASKMSHLDKYKGRAALETDEQEELLTLSRGWINFYLLRGDSQEVTSENGIHEEVFVRTPNTSPADYGDQQMNSKPMPVRKSPDEEMGQYTVHIHAAPESMRHNVKFPGVSLQSSHNRHVHPRADDINLPDIASPPQSASSSATSRSPLQPKIDPQTLPSLSLPLNGMRKPRKSRDIGSSMMKNRDEQCLAASNVRYDADLSPPNTPKSIMSRSGELACSEQSITSSSCGSESPKFLSDKRWSNHRHRRNLNTSTNSWSVTVAGNQEANTDVEMKLAFSHSQDRQKSVGSSSQQWTLTVNSGKRDRSMEKPRDETFQCLPDLDAHQHHHQIHKKGWKHTEQTTPSAEQLSLFWPAVQEIIEKNMILQNSARLDPEWTPEKNEDRKSKLSVTGWAITPEKKPRVPTQSERDLTRLHCPRSMKQRQFNFA